MRDTTFFSQIPQNAFEGGGFHFCNPAFYYDFRSVQITFMAPINTVKALLPSNRMYLLPVTLQSTLVIITAFEYRDTDIGPYNEVLFGFPVTLDKPPLPLLGVRGFMREPTLYVWQLPVTTEIARYGGVEFFNFPKIVADIDFSDQDDTMQCRAVDGGREIFSMKVHKVLGSRPVRSRANLLTLREDRILRTPIVQMAQSVGESSRKEDITFTLGDHPIANSLRMLPLGRVVNYSYTPQSQMVLPSVLESFPAR